MDIYILEDNIIQQGRLEQALDKALRSYGETLDCVQTFEQSNQLLEYIKPANHQQLFFLDIEIKRERKRRTPFGTNHPKQTTRCSYCLCNLPLRVYALNF